MLLSQMPEAINAICVQLKTAIADAYRQGQQAERERIKEIVRDEYANRRIDFARIMERIDDSERR